MDESAVRQRRLTGEPTTSLQFSVSDCPTAFLQAQCSLSQVHSSCVQLPKCAIRAAGVMALYLSPAIMQAW